MLLAAEAHHLLFELCVMVSGLASVCDVASEPSFRFGSVSTLCARSCVLRTKVYERCTKVYERCREVYERCTEVYAEVYERCTRGAPCEATPHDLPAKGHPPPCVVTPKSIFVQRSSSLRGPFDGVLAS